MLTEATLLARERREQERMEQRRAENRERRVPKKMQMAWQAYLAQDHQPAVFDPKKTSQAWNYDTNGRHHDYAPYPYDYDPQNLPPNQRRATNDKN